MLAIAAVAAGLLMWPTGVGRAASPSPTPGSVPGSAPGATPASPPTSSKNAAYGLGPASATALDDRPTYVWSVTPSATLTDHVAVVNYGTAPLPLDLYARDAFNAPSGALTLQAKAAKPTDAGSWIALEIPGGKTTVTVPARSTVIVPVSLTVPHDASPGDHTAGIITSLTATATATNGQQTFNQNLEQRVAVPVQIRISGPVHPGLTIQALKASYGQATNPVGGGHATVIYHVANTGNVNLGGQQQLSISGLFGSSVHVAGPNLPVLLPGSSVAMSVPFHGVLPEFLMSARVTITPSAAAGNVDPGLVVSTAKKHFWAVPWLLLAIIALVPLTWRQFRRMKRRSTGRHGAGSAGGRRRRGSASTPPTRSSAANAPGGISVTNGLARVVRRLALIAVAAFAFAAPVGTAFATSLPYTDKAAQGAIGLCDKSGNNITHGSVYDKPFVWRAVGETPAPASVRGSGRTATLYGFQPRKGIDPAQWSGEQLTANAAYSDPNIPIAQATDRDEALSDYLNDAPPQWDRLIELRMFYGATSGDITASYPVANIRVTGTNWALVTGAKVNCKTGSAISSEDALASSNPAGRGPAAPLSALAARAVGAPLPKSSSSLSAAGAAGASTTAIKSSSSRGGGGTAGALLTVGVIVVLGSGGGLYWLKKGRA